MRSISSYTLPEIPKPMPLGWCLIEMAAGHEPRKVVGDAGWRMVGGVEFICVAVYRRGVDYPAVKLINPAFVTCITPCKEEQARSLINVKLSDADELRKAGLL